MAEPEDVSAIYELQDHPPRASPLFIREQMATMALYGMRTVIGALKTPSPTGVVTCRIYGEANTVV